MPSSGSISPTVPAAVAPAALAGVITEAILYGFVVVLTIVSLYILGWRRREYRNIPMIVASVLLFGLATAHFVVDCVAIFQAFQVLDYTARLKTIANSTRRINLAKVAIFDVSMVVGDAVIIYRAFIVWGRNFWVIIPSIILSIASAIISSLTVYAGCQPRTKLGAKLLKNIQNYGVEGFVLSLAANMFATGLIAFRIWRHDSNILLRQSESQPPKHGRRTNSLLPVARIVIESGALNAAFLITYTAVLITTRFPGNLAIVADMILVDISSCIVAIVFSMVIVRAGLRTKEEEKWPTASTSFGFRSNSRGHVLSTWLSHQPSGNATSTTQFGSTDIEVGELDSRRGEKKPELDDPLRQVSLGLNT